MRLGGAFLVVVLAVTAAGQTAPKSGPEAARKLVNEAAEQARQGHLDSAFLLAKMAADLAEHSPEFDGVRETLRQRATLAHLEAAHQFDREGNHTQAAVEYRSAMQLDPANADARAGLGAEFPASVEAPPGSTELRVQSALPPIQLQPATSRLDFHLRTDTRQAIAQIAAGYALKAYVADDVPNRPVHLDIADATFAQAMQALYDAEDLSWIPLNPTTLYFETAAKMRTIQPLAERTFYVPWVTDGPALTELTTAIKSLLGLQTITLNVAANAIAVRATPEQLDAVEQLLLNLRHSTGDVVLEVRVLEVNRTAAMDLGVGLPAQFTMFSLGPLLSELQASNGNLQNNILQLFEQGGLNAILSSGQLPPGLLQQAQTTLSPLLQSPFVVFGGGATLTAVSVPPFGINVSDTQNSVQSIESALLRAGNGVSADLKVGERFPIVNASFSPILLSSAISQVIGNGSFQQPFPSFTYEDLGLEVKITPHISSSDRLTLQAEITSKALAGASVNNIPILTNRQLTTTLSVRDGEPILMAGLLDKEEDATLAGLPGLSNFPLLSRLFSTNTTNQTDEELMLVITPHIQHRPDGGAAEIWLPPNVAAAGPDMALPAGGGPPGLIQPGRGPGVPVGVPVQPGQPPAAAPGGRGGPGGGGGTR